MDQSNSSTPTPTYFIQQYRNPSHPIFQNSFLFSSKLIISPPTNQLDNHPAMKVIKTMKKLKFWSGKKKKKVKRFNVDIDHYLLPPPPTCHWCNCYHNGSRHDLVQPSAPPLPSWLDLEQTQDTLLTREEISTSFSSMPDSIDQSQSENEIAASLPAAVSTNCSYQQYMVENPVLGVSVVLPPPRREIHNGIFGCGVHLIRCFCPCFHIHSVY